MTSEISICIDSEGSHVVLTIDMDYDDPKSFVLTVDEAIELQIMLRCAINDAKTQGDIT